MVDPNSMARTLNPPSIHVELASQQRWVHVRLGCA
jgi:hypothetical protein